MMSNGDLISLSPNECDIKSGIKQFVEITFLKKTRVQLSVHNYSTK